MKKKSENRKNNKSIIVSTLIFVITFIAMAGYLIYFNLTQAESIINNSYNKRQGVLSRHTIRGSILSDDKTKLAVTNVDDDGNETRETLWLTAGISIVGTLTMSRTALFSVEK